MRLFAPVFALLLVWLPLEARSEQYAFNFVGQYRLAIERRLEADKKLLDNMNIVADYLSQFRSHYGHLPEPGVEQAACIEKLQSFLKANPYSTTGLQTAADLKPCPLRFVYEYALDESYCKRWQNKPPSDWKAEPGTITVVMSQSSYLLVWGSGADRTPIFDDRGKSYSFACRDLSAEM